ncbi:MULTISPECIES: magnesium transporter [Xanthomonas]|uniref:Magnesium transporter MgtE n=1 Tax=Xanthomonas arboricola TaxID=56448 RepID=A0AB73GZ81_9XANT|nr:MULTISPECIES: magnesium transporter [Xanthomonas]KER85113.1 magnesium transporter [Xanthomonas arboricola pv. celebensis]MBB3850468.1 magnesium transporter [Xanthomonas arboricola]MBB4599228.1 magnesium transporter [Xanthomonas arboricola]MBB4771414.1 magnesium transporter [Xanthomonas arboricola]MBB5671112.1 magnesium transporter [Xanthomonas arboricola]
MYNETLRLAQGVDALIAPIADFNTADAVEYLNTLDRDEAAQVLAALPQPRAVKLLEQPELHAASALVALLPAEQAASLLGQMADDRATDIFHGLDAEQRQPLLWLLSAEARLSIQALMRYPPNTAGALMTTEFVAVPADWTVGRTLQHIREVERSRETVYAIYLLDPHSRVLTQVVTMRRLITGAPEAPILEVAQVNPPVTVDPALDQEEVARLIRRHDLLAIPVVDAHGHVLGIVTVDDVLDALIAESTEDVHKFGGMEALDKPYMQIGFGQMIKKRAGWLSVLFLGEMLTASAMQHFEDELSKAVVLTLFIPLIMSSGGNSGSQATSLLIRSLALRELRLGDWWKVALRELPTGLTLGTILGILAIVRITIWQTAGLYDYGPHWQMVALTIGAALIGIVTFGSLSGSMLPFVLQRLGFDPASASAPFVATLVDVTGLVIYFSIAAAILSGTLL